MRTYLEEIKHLENWCQENNLLLNISKTKELIVDCSKKQVRHYQPVRISGTTVERVDSFRYLEVHISQDLSWSRHTNSLAKKARQCLYHLRRLRDFRLPSKVLRNFYTCTIEKHPHGEHHSLTIYYKRCQTKVRKIVKDPTHPNNRLFTLLSSSDDPDTNPSSVDDTDINASSSDDSDTNPSSSDDPDTNASSSDDSDTNPSSSDDPDTNPSSSDDSDTNPSSSDDPDTNASSSDDSDTNASSSDDSHPPDPTCALFSFP
ncbi:hypothetical protein P4O66_004826, partial [Electrophorus voltai]